MTMKEKNRNNWLKQKRNLPTCNTENENMLEKETRTVPYIHMFNLQSVYLKVQRTDVRHSTCFFVHHPSTMC